MVKLEDIVQNKIPNEESFKSLISTLKLRKWLHYIPVLVIDPSESSSFKRFGCCHPFLNSDGQVCVFPIDEDEDDTLTPNLRGYVPLETIRIRPFPCIEPPSYLRRKSFGLDVVLKEFKSLECSTKKSDLINPNIFAYWPDDSIYYKAKVDKIDLDRFPKIYHAKYCDGDEGWLSKENIVPDVIPSFETLVFSDVEEEEEEEEEGEVEGESSYPVIAFSNGFYYRGCLKKGTNGKILTYFIGNEEGYEIPEHLVRIDASELLVRKSLQESKNKKEKQLQRLPKEKVIDDFMVGDNVFAFCVSCYYFAKVVQNKEEFIEVEFKDLTKKTFTKSEISKRGGELYLLLHDQRPSDESCVKRGEHYLVHWKAGQYYEALLYDFIETPTSKKFHFIYNDLDEGLVEFQNIRLLPQVSREHDTPVGSFSLRPNHRMKINDEVFYPLIAKCYLEDPTQEIISECERSKSMFVESDRDEVFSICSTYNHNTLKRRKCCVLREFVRWERISNIVSGEHFPNSFAQELDFCQSKNLGDCWILSMFPHLFKDKRILDSVILKPRETFKHGFFTCCLKEDLGEGRLRNVYFVIDDFVPVFKNTNAYVFAKAEKSLFVVVLEKLFAKVFGGYQNLCGGRKGVLKNRSTLVSKMMFGSLHYESIKWKHGEAPKGLKERILRLQSRSVEDNGVVVVMNLFMGKNENGIVSGHAYSLMEVVVVEEVFLLGINNPTGEVWKGSWEHLIQGEVKDQLMERMKNGFFFMDFRSFVCHFGQIDMYSNSELC